MQDTYPPRRRKVISFRVEALVEPHHFPCQDRPTLEHYIRVQADDALTAGYFAGVRIEDIAIRDEVQED
jgi:hypothetical protein